jgi:hypothetical protein
MKNTVFAFLLVLMSMMFFGSCEKIEDRRGTLTVKIVNAEYDSSTKVQVSVYPYTGDMDSFHPIAQSEVEKSASSSVSLSLMKVIIMSPVRVSQRKRPSRYRLERKPW